MRLRLVKLCGLLTVIGSVLLFGCSVFPAIKTLAHMQDIIAGALETPHTPNFIIWLLLGYFILIELLISIVSPASKKKGD